MESHQSTEASVADVVSDFCFQRISFQGTVAEVLCSVEPGDAELLTIPAYSVTANQSSTPLQVFSSRGITRACINGIFYSGVKIGVVGSPEEEVSHQVMLDTKEGIVRGEASFIKTCSDTSVVQLLSDETVNLAIQLPLSIVESIAFFESNPDSIAISTRIENKSHCSLSSEDAALLNYGERCIDFQGQIPAKSIIELPIVNLPVTNVEFITKISPFAEIKPQRFIRIEVVAPKTLDAVYYDSENLPVYHAQCSADFIEFHLGPDREITLKHLIDGYGITSQRVSTRVEFVDFTGAITVNGAVASGSGFTIASGESRVSVVTY